MMKAVLVKGDGSSAKDLYIGEAEQPKPTEGQVLVKVKAFGLNRMDIMQRMGKYPVPPGVSSILGVEFSGTIEESKTDKWKHGDQVFGLAFGGAYAEYIACAEGMITEKPKELDWVQAASIPENWLTAYQSLFYVNDFKKGDSVMVHAGASGVGLAVIQLAKEFGAPLVIATAGSDEKVKFIEKHGAKGINYKTQKFDEEVLKLTDKRGVDVIVDLVGQSHWEGNLNSLARDGRMSLVGVVSGMKTEKPLDLAPILYKRLRITGTTLRSRTLEYQSRLLQDFSKEALEKIYHKCSGRDAGLDLTIHKVYDWKDVTAAHEEMEAARNIGKIICEIK